MSGQLPHDLVHRAKRLPEIDMLRGISLLGILLVNAHSFNWTVLGNLSRTSITSGALDIAADFLSQWLFTGKFILIFSFLLGWGIHTQTTEDGPFRRRYLRRLLGLLLLGLAHGLLFFSGDILIVYGILGLFMLRPIRHEWPVRKLVRSAVLLMLIQAVLVGLMSWVFSLSTDESDGDDSWSWVTTAFSQGSFGTAVVARAFELGLMAPGQIFLLGPLLVATFRLGLAAARTYSGAGLAAAAPIALWLVRWLLVPALLLNAVMAWFGMYASAAVRPQVQLASILAAPLLTLVYLALAALVLGRYTHMRPATWLSAAGRMSLTGYVGQSALMSFTFCGYGLGLLGRVGAAALVAISLAVYVIMVAFSVLWLSRFRIGPLEWLLRSLTAWQFGGSRREVPAA